MQQSELPTLLVTCADSSRKDEKEETGSKSPSEDNKRILPICKSACVLSSRKKPAIGDPYRSSLRLARTPSGGGSRSAVEQRVTSAKVQKIKHLQNQLADAHYHLNEISSENRLLKSLQKRQDSALRKFEGTQAELPRIINTHNEDLRVSQTNYKKLKAEYKSACDKLKDRDNEIQVLQAQNKHLSQLNADRHLLEREKLQMLISDLNHRIEQQHQTIQTLNKKLQLETKSMKQQLSTEISKHKETQKSLDEALEKLSNLEVIMDSREKRAHSAMPSFDNRFSRKRLPKMSLDSLVASSSTTTNQSEKETKEVEPVVETKPVEPESAADSDVKILPKPLRRSETMESLEKVKSFRLKNFYSRSASPTKSDDIDRMNMFRRNSAMPALQYRDQVNSFDDFPSHSDDELNFRSEDSEGDSEDTLGSNRLFNKSRELHARLIKSITDDRQLESINEVSDTSTSCGLNSTIEAKESKEVNDTTVPALSKEDHKKFFEPDSDTSDSDLEIDNNGSLEKAENFGKTDEDVIEKSTKAMDELRSEFTTATTEKQSSRHSDILETLFKSENDVATISGNSSKSNSPFVRSKSSKFRSDSTELSKSSSSRSFDESYMKNETPLLQDETTSTDSRVKSTDELDTSSVKTTISSIDNHETVNDKRPAEVTPLRKLDKNGKANGDVKGKELTKKFTYNKEKLLAAIKAIDDNDNNIAFVESKVSNKPKFSSRSKITENLYRGLPAHFSKRDQLVKEIFSCSDKTTK